MSPEPQRGRYQISLRWMLGAFTIFAMLFATAGYLLQQWNSAEEGRRRQRMNELILSNGGYWEAGQDLNLGNTTKTQLDAVLKELKAFDGQVSMSFPNSQFCDAQVKDVVCHRGLTSLVLDNTLVTDDGLKELAALKNLTWLSLDNTAVTDIGLEHLTELPELQNLSLSFDTITDVGLDHLAKLPKLKHLYVTEAKVTVDGVAKLKRALPDLEVKVHYGR